MDFLASKGLLDSAWSESATEYLAGLDGDRPIGEGTFRIPSEEELTIARSVFGTKEL